VERKPLILASLLLAAFAINLDTTIVNVALPTLVRELDASTTQLVWIVDAYTSSLPHSCCPAETSVIVWGGGASCSQAWGCSELPPWRADSGTAPAS
jgi:MFS family permease